MAKRSLGGFPAGQWLTVAGHPRVKAVKVNKDGTVDAKVLAKAARNPKKKKRPKKATKKPNTKRVPKKRKTPKKSRAKNVKRKPPKGGWKKWAKKMARARAR